MDDMKLALSEFLEGVERLAICGVGNPDAADDKVGIEVIAGLEPHRSDRLLPLDCGQRPDAFVRDIVEFGPTHVLIIDAASMQCPPGDVRLVEPTEVRTGMMSTHSFIMAAFMQEIMIELPGIKMKFVCIQAVDVTPGREMCADVAGSVRETVALLDLVIKEKGLGGGGGE